MFVAEVLSNIKRKPLYFLMSFKHMELNKVSDQLLGWKTVWNKRSYRSSSTQPATKSSKRLLMLSSREWPLTLTAMVTAASHNTGVRESGFKFLVLLFEKHKLQLDHLGENVRQSPVTDIWHTSNRGHKTIFTTVQEQSLQLVMFFLDLKKWHIDLCV